MHANHSQPHAPVNWQENLAIVLIETRNPLNIGAAARAMWNFGFSRLALVSPYEVAFREARSAAGASLVLKEARVFSGLEEALAGCTLVAGTASAGRRVFQQPRYPLADAAVLLREHLQREPAALLFGSEKFGLSNEHLSYCHWTLRIPTNSDCPSMNLGQAVAVCCYELARTTASPFPAITKGPGNRAAADQLQRLAARLSGVLDASGYINARTRRSNLLKIRRLINRLNLSAADARVLEGMLRQIAWKLGCDNTQSDR
ncbi:MAG TPA: RNA methyltransferase [Bryobacterales bacterium]|jgi:TrmH family RNA methyltransferase|nr:RNA methyltransferase [Bryobacterales bacterium]